MAIISFCVYFEPPRTIKVENIDATKPVNILNAGLDKELHFVLYRTYVKSWMKNLTIEIYGINESSIKKLFYCSMEIAPGQVIDFRQYIGVFDSVKIVVYLENTMVLEEIVNKNEGL
ncbi:MAG: hypothetical protein B6U95_04835 [Thermofilum sp. ex4484_82]|nr:MAG: hypothetical protein B6U95_04835 [Thermofilum sp. ex4484_82]